MCFWLRRLEPLVYHIPLGEIIEIIDNWASAMFVSPNIFYASKYLEMILSENKEWLIIIEAIIEPNSFTMHENTIYGYKFKNSEPKKLNIYRIDRSEYGNCPIFNNLSDSDDIQTSLLLYVNRHVCVNKAIKNNE